MTPLVYHAHKATVNSEVSVFIVSPYLLGLRWQVQLMGISRLDVRVSLVGWVK